MGAMFEEEVSEDENQLRSPFGSSFRTFDAYDYSNIATIDIKKNIFDLAVGPGDCFIAVVENSTRMSNDMMSSSESVCRLYEVGRRKEEDDDEEGDEEEEEEEDLDGDDDSEDDNLENTDDVHDHDESDGDLGLGLDSDDSDNSEGTSLGSYEGSSDGSIDVLPDGFEELYADEDDTDVTFSDTGDE